MRQFQMIQEKANSQQMNMTFNGVSRPQAMTPDIPANYNPAANYQPPVFLPMPPQGHPAFNQPQFVPTQNMGIRFSENRPLIGNGPANPQGYFNYPNLASQNDLSQPQKHQQQPFQYPAPTPSQ